MMLVATAMPMATRTRLPGSSLCRPASATPLAPPGRWPRSSPSFLDRRQILASGRRV